MGKPEPAGGLTVLARPGNMRTMNALQHYFVHSGDTPTALARRIGREPSTITRVAKGQRGASKVLAREISEATGGRVSAADIFVIALDCPPRVERAA